MKRLTGLMLVVVATVSGRGQWTEGAWPACAHVGGREFSPGVLYKQVWARDIFRAFEERSRAIYPNGSLGVWATLGEFVSGPAWWSETGITNQVVRYDRPAVQIAGVHVEGNVLPTLKHFGSLLAQHFIDQGRLDTTSMPGAFHQWQINNGARTNQVVFDFTYTDWRWDCPGEAHTFHQPIYEVASRANPPYPMHTPTGLLARVALPLDYWTISPWRLLEGFCDPASSVLGPSFVYASGSPQGPSPHASGLWYWSDFGWDGLRTALQQMRHRIVREDAQQEVRLKWTWDEDDGESSALVYGGSSERIYHRPLEGGPDEVVQEGSFDAALADQILDTRFDPDDEDPFYCYNHYFYAYNLDPDPGDLYGCSWSTDFKASKRKLALEPTFAWPPATVGVVLRAFVDVQTFNAPNGQAVLDTQLVGELVPVGPSTNRFVFSTVYGHITPQEGLRPGDPASARGLPGYWGLGGTEPGYDNSNSAAHFSVGNSLIEFKAWRNPFALITYTWSYP